MPGMLVAAGLVTTNLLTDPDLRAAGTLQSPGDILAKTDGRSFAVTAEKDGKIRVRCGAWDGTKVIERDQDRLAILRSRR
jgi:hypothetical protein